MTEEKFIKILSKILNKKILVTSDMKLNELSNIDSLEFVKLLIGFKDHGIVLSISDLENLTIKELIFMINK